MPAVAPPQSAPVANANLATLADIVGFLEQNGAMILASQVVHYVELVKLEPQRLEFHPAVGADPKLAADLGRKLSDYTGTRWVVTISMKEGEKTIAARHREALAAEDAAVRADPVIARILATFPGTEILSIT